MWSRGRTAAAALVLAGGPAGAETVQLPVTMDTSICCHSSERELNAGGAARIKLKGNENIILLDFYAQPVRGRLVRRATLRIREAEPDPMIRRIGLSTVATGWDEGTSSYEPGAGACFLRPASERNWWWAGAGSVFLEAVFGRGGTLWTRTIASRGADGWWTIPVDPRLIEAHGANISSGLAVSDDSGQTLNVSRAVVPKSNLSNNWFWSREQAGQGPYLEVGLVPGPAPDSGPAPLDVTVAPWPAGAGASTGGIEVAWPGPVSAEAAAGLLGYRVWLTIGTGKAALLPRWMHPGIPPPNELARILVPNMPPGTSVIAEVEVIGRGGASLSRGQGGGFASANLPVPPPIALASAARPVAGAAAVRAAGVWVVPDGTKVNPVTGNVLEDPSAEYLGEPGGTWRAANPGWDGARRSVSLSAIRGEWVAFQVVVEHRGPAAARWRIAPGDLKGPGGSVIPASAIRLSRAAYLRIGNGWYADPLVPLEPDSDFRIPANDAAFPEQVNQTIYVEFRVPESCRPGKYRGKVEVKPAVGGSAVPLDIALTVASPVMPPEAHFVWSMNAYSSPGAGAERAYYALAHDHRTNLAILHYSHSGNYEPGCVPAVAGRGPSARVADWTEWDRRFGPLFDGTAFADTSRPGLGLDHFYLALSEHYPVPMSEGYKWNNVRWEDHWKAAGTVEEGFSREMQETWAAVAKDYISHVKARGWRTRFQVYLNDKYYYKMYDQKRKEWGRGVSFWLLDEPVHPDDFLALGFFGRLLRAAQAGDRSRVEFRADVSQPEWSRDILDRLLDLNVTGGWRPYRRLLEGWKALFGQRYWTYGDTPPATMSAISLSTQALALYSEGVDGYVPWLVLGEDRNWTDFSSTSVIYPGAPAGVTGPCASLRLKAYRRAEQDVEYVWLYADRRGWLRDDPFRRRIAALLSEVLNVGATFGFLDSEGARTTQYEGLSPATLESLRSALRSGM